jgi:hypothetical protein
VPKPRKLPPVSRRHVRRAARILAALVALAVYALAPLSDRWTLAAATVAAGAAAYAGTRWALSSIGTAALSRTGRK